MHKIGTATASGYYCKGKRKGTMPYKCHFGVLFTSDYHSRKRALTCLPQRGLNSLAWHPGKGCLGERHVTINRVFWVTAEEGKKLQKPICHVGLTPFWTFTQLYVLFHLGWQTDNRNRNVFDFFICWYTKSVSRRQQESKCIISLLAAQSFSPGVWS